MYNNYKIQHCIKLSISLLFFAFLWVSCGEDEPRPLSEEILGLWILDQIETVCTSGDRATFDGDNDGCVTDTNGRMSCFTFTFMNDGIVSATNSEEDIDDGTYTVSEENRSVIMCFQSCFDISISEDETFILESEVEACFQNLQFKKS